MDAQQTRVLIAIVGTAVVFGSVLVALFLLLIRQHRHRLRVERAARVLEFNALERERARLAADLHDELSPLVTALKLGLNNVEPSRPADEERLQKAHGFIGELSKKMREVSFDLMPEALKRKGLAEAVREFTGFIGRNHPLQFELDLPSIDVQRIHQETSVQLYRILQEIVHNTLKHAQASQLEIRLSVNKDHLLIRTRDNGRGFEKGAAGSGAEGLGIKTIAGRVELLGGELEMDSRPGEGTRYLIEIPLPP